jgi:hypothetical protein
VNAAHELSRCTQFQRAPPSICGLIRCRRHGNRRPEQGAHERVDFLDFEEADPFLAREVA